MTLVGDYGKSSRLNLSGEHAILYPYLGFSLFCTYDVKSSILKSESYLTIYFILSYDLGFGILLVVDFV